jgi:hypothetical protein
LGLFVQEVASVRVCERAASSGGKATWDAALSLPICADQCDPNPTVDVDGTLPTLEITVMDHRKLLSDVVLAQGSLDINQVLLPTHLELAGAPSAVAAVAGAGAFAGIASGGAAAGPVRSAAITTSDLAVGDETAISTAGFPAASPVREQWVTLGGNSGDMRALPRVLLELAFSKGALRKLENAPAPHVCSAPLQPRMLRGCLSHCHKGSSLHFNTALLRPVPKACYMFRRGGLYLLVRFVCALPSRSRCPEPAVPVHVTPAREVPLSGVVRVHLLRARSLTLADTVGSQDPFCRLSVVSYCSDTDASAKPSAVVAPVSNKGIVDSFVCVDSGNRAVWNQVLDVPMPPGITDPSLRVVVLDKESLVADKVIGEAIVQLSPLLRNGVGGPVWVPLVGSAGQVRLAMEFIPYVQDL